MGWSYDSSLANEKDQVRFLIQDTNSSKQIFQDEEIDWVIQNQANVYMAAATMCDTLVAKIGGGGGVKSRKIDELAITYDVAFYTRLSGTLRGRGSSHQMPFAGGISMADKATLQNDADWNQPAAQRGLGDNPQAPRPVTTQKDPLTQI